MSDQSGGVGFVSGIVAIFLVFLIFFVVWGNSTASYEFRIWLNNQPWPYHETVVPRNPNYEATHADSVRAIAELKNRKEWK